MVAGRKNQGRIDGDLLYGGKRPNPSFLKRQTGYVEQFDTLASPSPPFLHCLLDGPAAYDEPEEPLFSYSGVLRWAR